MNMLDGLVRPKAEPQAFVWPMPPSTPYPEISEPSEDEPCEFVGLNGQLMVGQFRRIDVLQSTFYVQLPTARSALPLRFEHAQYVLLKRVIKPAGITSGAASSDHEALAHQSVDYQVNLLSGDVLSGKTIGHVERPFGLFLFPPAPENEGFLRLFIPATSIRDFSIGDPIGQVLVASQIATQQQVNDAIAVQAQLRNRKLGEIMVSQQLLTPDQLLQAIEKQARMPMVRIGEALLALGMITQAQLAKALQEQEHERGIPLGKIMVRMEMVTGEDIRVALARKMGYPLVDLAQFPVEENALEKIPFALAFSRKVLPILMRDSKLVVAMNDPSDRRVLSELSFITQCKIAPVMCKQSEIEPHIVQTYKNFGTDTSTIESSDVNNIERESTALLLAQLENDEEAHVELDDPDKPSERSDNILVRFINNMIVDAYEQGASDIHIETYTGKEKLRIRFRKDGTLIPYMDLPHIYKHEVVSRIKIMCDLDISERRKPQDGKINFARFMPHYKLELRVASIPTNNSMEDLVMRLLASAKPLPLDKIGLSDWNLQKLQEAMARPYGMVLCVGPTGSGKTTTLHSAMSYINSPDKKIWTAEDPVEITQNGLRQVQVNPKIDWTFAKALRAFLRADPDVIMVGEMRDTETAHMGVEASLTGHLVLSTLHTNSAPETVTRLLDMGMDPFNFSDSLLVVLAQRLIKRLCIKCRQQEPADEDRINELLNDYLHNCPQDPQFERDIVRNQWLSRHAKEGRLSHFHSPGCQHCNFTGYAGRVGIHELMIMTRPLRRLIQTSARSEDLMAQAMLDGMRTLRQDGIDKVLAGLVSLEDVRATSNA